MYEHARPVVPEKHDPTEAEISEYQAVILRSGRAVEKGGMDELEYKLTLYAARRLHEMVLKLSDRQIAKPSNDDRGVFAARLPKRLQPELKIARTDLSIIEILEVATEVLEEHLSLPAAQEDGVASEPKVLNRNDLKVILGAKYDPAPTRALMEALGYGQNEFARVLGTSSSNVSRWLHGRPPTADYFARMKALAYAHGVPSFNPVEKIHREPVPPSKKRQLL